MIAATLQPVTQCRVCGSRRVLPTEYRKPYYLINLDQVVELSYSICQDCQFIFEGEYVGDEFLGRYYAASPMLRRPEPTPYEIDQNVRQAAFLSRHVELSGRRVLEIGAHAGAFLRHLHAHCGCETYFDDLSEEARAVLSSHAELCDIRREPPGTTVDVVVLRHVLEHIFDLDAFLDYVAALLAPGGAVFIEVPDWSELDDRTDPLIFEHLNQFSTNNLVLLLRRTGWVCHALDKSIADDDPATPNRVQRVICRRAHAPNPGDAAIVGAFRRFLTDNYEQANRAIDALVGRLDRRKRIALYPASHLTFSALLETRLREANIIGMFDIDTKKHGKTVDGIIVRPATELRDEQPDLVLVFTMAYEREIRESFAAMGLRSEVISITQLLNR